MHQVDHKYTTNFDFSTHSREIDIFSDLTVAFSRTLLKGGLSSFAGL